MATYTTAEEADRAIRSLHNRQTVPGGVGSIQVRCWQVLGQWTNKLQKRKLRDVFHHMVALKMFISCVLSKCW